MPEGRESPSPEQSSGAQQRDPPASGKGTDDATNKQQTNKDQLEGLKSNPKDVMEDEVNKKFSKTQK